MKDVDLCITQLKLTSRFFEAKRERAGQWTPVLQQVMPYVVQLEISQYNWLCLTTIFLTSVAVAKFPFELSCVIVRVCVLYFLLFARQKSCSCKQMARLGKKTTQSYSDC